MTGGDGSTRSGHWLASALLLATALAACGSGSTATPPATSSASSDVTADETSGFCDELTEFLNTSSDGVFSLDYANMATSLADSAPADLKTSVETMRDEIVEIAELDETDPDAALDAFAAIGPDSDYLEAVGVVFAWGDANCGPGA